MIERGHGAEKPKYFTFGAEHDGKVMPHDTVMRILDNGCFHEGFKESLRRVWRSVPEIEQRLSDKRDALVRVGEGVRNLYAKLRE